MKPLKIGDFQGLCLFTIGIHRVNDDIMIVITMDLLSVFFLENGGISCGKSSINDGNHKDYPLVMTNSLLLKPWP